MKLVANTLGLVPYLCAGYLFWSVRQYYGELTPQPLDISGTEQPHRIGWRPPMKYDFAVYATDVPSYYVDRLNFFRDAQLIWKVKELDVSATRPHFHKRARIEIPERVRNDGFRTMYLHLIMQQTGAMEPHPAMNDRFAIYATSDLIKPRALHGNYSHVVAHGNTRVVWEYVLDDNHFEMWKAPRDLARMLDFTYYSPNERRAYKPILWNNPTYADGMPPTRWAPLSDHLDVSADAPMTATHMDVDIDLTGVSMAWIRFNQLLRLTEEPEPMLELAKSLVVSVLDHGLLAYYALAALFVVRVLAEAFWRQTLIRQYMMHPLSAASYVSTVFCFVSAALGMTLPFSGIGVVDHAMWVVRVGCLAMESAKVLRLAISRPQLSRHDTSVWVVVPAVGVAVFAASMLRATPGDAGTVWAAQALVLGIGLVVSQLSQLSTRPNWMQLSAVLLVVAGDVGLTKAAGAGDPRVLMVWPALLVPLVAPLLGHAVLPSARSKNE
ncbi:hypothetical protein FBU59_000109 [Linderina macrospora]|uniref:Uncharacterized protein n=1 Tax=Linderina macrospora TaxID=4868 RepID=A0ACC1JHI8_9FUNG|nr:hypothetical protein FBU59_000109 [Linderina macrospora]